MIREADLGGANLVGAVLSHSNLLTGADLSDARLDKADQREADLTDANLNGTDLTAPELSGVMGITEDLPTSQPSSSSSPTYRGRPGPT